MPGIGYGVGNIPFKGQFNPPVGSKSPGLPVKSNINLSTGVSTTYGGTQFDTKLAHGADDTREQFKGLPGTGFTPGTVMFQQRLRLMFIQLVQSGMSHKDAAKHIQATYGVHARTGQKLVQKVGFTKEKHVTYAGHYSTAKHYRGRTGHHRPRRPLPNGTPAGLK